jgi:hypothetical protein
VADPEAVPRPAEHEAQAGFRVHAGRGQHLPQHRDAGGVDDFAVREQRGAGDGDDLLRRERDASDSDLENDDMRSV